jgi:hypothetical protein
VPQVSVEAYARVDKQDAQEAAKELDDLVQAWRDKWSIERSSEIKVTIARQQDF